MDNQRADLVRLTRLRDRRRKALEVAESQLAGAIRRALAVGMKAADVAFIVDISRARVYQIRDGKR